MTEQLFAKELKCSFNLRTPRSDKPSLIYMVTRLFGRQYKFSTGAKVYPAHWDSTAHRAVTSGDSVSGLDVSNNSMANSRIELFARRFEAFRASLLRCHDSSADIPSRMRDFILSPPDDNHVGGMLYRAFSMLYPAGSTPASTLRTNKSRLRKIDEFFAASPPESLGQRAMDDFSDYLESKGTGVRYMNECCGLLKRLINCAARMTRSCKTVEGKVEYTALKDRRRSDDSKKGCLESNELEALRRVSLSGREDFYRRIFLLQTESGVRVSDLPAILEADMSEADCCISFTTRKEGIDAMVFVNGYMRQLIEDCRRAYVKPAVGNEFARSYNKGIKKIARKAGLDREVRWKEQRGKRLVSLSAPLHEVISSHFARHTFITTRIREGWSADKLKFLTGHADETMIRRVYTHLSAADRRNLVMAERRRLICDVG